MSQDALGQLKHLKTARSRWPFPDAFSISIIQESGILTLHFGIPASFSTPLATVGRRAGILYSFLGAGQRHPMSIFVMRTRGGTGGVGHVWRAGGCESV